MYSKKIRAALLHPINGDTISPYNCKGSCKTEERCRTNPNRTVQNDVEFQLFIWEGVIHDARWRVFGDPVAIATASWCVQQSRGKTIAELVHVVTPERVAMDLEVTEEVDIRGGCMAAIGAFIAALDDYKQSPPIT